MAAMKMSVIIFGSVSLGPTKLVDMVNDYPRRRKHSSRSNPNNVCSDIAQVTTELE